MHAIRVLEHGGPEVMEWTGLPDPLPAPGEALVRPAAIGVNYMDVGAREVGGPGWQPPFLLGVEGAGRVVALGHRRHPGRGAAADDHGQRLPSGGRARRGHRRPARRRYGVKVARAVSKVALVCSVRSSGPESQMSYVRPSCSQHRSNVRRGPLPSPNPS